MILVQKTEQIYLPVDPKNSYLTTQLDVRFDNSFPYAPLEITVSYRGECPRECRGDEIKIRYSYDDNSRLDYTWKHIGIRPFRWQVYWKRYIPYQTLQKASGANIKRQNLLVRRQYQDNCLGLSGCDIKITFMQKVFKNVLKYHSCSKNGYIYIRSLGMCYKYHHDLDDISWDLALNICKNENSTLLSLKSRKAANILRRVFSEHPTFNRREIISSFLFLGLKGKVS